MQKRRLARLLVVVVLATGVAACGGGATAGDGIMSPPSTSPK